MRAGVVHGAAVGNEDPPLEATLSPLAPLGVGGVVSLGAHRTSFFISKNRPVVVRWAIKAQGKRADLTPPK